MSKIRIISVVLVCLLLFFLFRFFGNSSIPPRGPKRIAKILNGGLSNEILLPIHLPERESKKKSAKQLESCDAIGRELLSLELTSYLKYDPEKIGSVFRITDANAFLEKIKSNFKMPSENCASLWGLGKSGLNTCFETHAPNILRCLSAVIELRNNALSEAKLNWPLTALTPTELWLRFSYLRRKTQVPEQSVGKVSRKEMNDSWKELHLASKNLLPALVNGAPDYSPGWDRLFDNLLDQEIMNEIPSSEVDNWINKFQILHPESDLSIIVQLQRLTRNSKWLEAETLIPRLRASSDLAAAELGDYYLAYRAWVNQDSKLAETILSNCVEEFRSSSTCYHALNQLRKGDPHTFGPRTTPRWENGPVTIEY